MPTEQAIKLAIEGSYKTGYFTYEVNSHEREVIKNITLLDPLFWQALGKAKGWEEWARCPTCDRVFTRPYILKYGGMKEWLYCWHRFVDALAGGKSPDDFFKYLLDGTALV